MKTYYVEEKWDNFKKYIIENFNCDDQDNIGFLASEKEIYIRSDHPKLIGRIMENYSLIEKILPKLIRYKTPFEFRNNLGNMGYFDD